MHRHCYLCPGPGTDVPSPDVVRVGGVSARTAYEFALALAVGLLAMSALGASPAGVPRVDRDHGDASKPGLVFHECSQLEEGPAREPIALVPAPSRDAFAD